jgi:diguanylate cyclase (GGDEF)-like protein
LKSINDAWGHQEGDLALIEIAKALKETLREMDIIARLGGDEFVALLIGTREADAQATATRLKEKLKARNAQGGCRYTLSASVGITCYDPGHPCSIEDLIARADVLMYEQKRGAS